MGKPMFDNEWFRLDNAAKIYPAAKNSRWNAVFRMSAVMKDKVDGDILQVALNDVIDRFPSFQVTLMKGVFWYYLQFLTKKPKVQEENDYPCKMFRIDGSSHLFRVVYHKYRISLEVFHSLTDGTGAMMFLKALLFRYLELKDVKVENIGDIMHYQDSPVEGEVEDAFSRNLAPEYGMLSRKEPPAYQIRGHKENNGVLDVIQGEVSVNELKTAAKKFGCTVNTYLTAVLEYVLMKKQIYDGGQTKKKPIKIQVPINLRKFFPSITVRNFAGYINTCISPEDKSFEEVIAETDRQLKENINEEYCHKFINSNVSVEKNILVRLAPRVIKSMIMKMSYYSFGERLTSCSFSNVGNVAMPVEFNDYIDRIEFVLGAQKYVENAVTCVSFNGKSVITFSKCIKGSTLERDFFRMLQEHGVNVSVISNRSE